MCAYAYMYIHVCAHMYVYMYMCVVLGIKPKGFIPLTDITLPPFLGLVLFCLYVF